MTRAFTRYAPPCFSSIHNVFGLILSQNTPVQRNGFTDGRASTRRSPVRHGYRPLLYPVAGLRRLLKEPGPYSRATRKAAAMVGGSVAEGVRRGSARRMPSRLAMPSRDRKSTRL